MRLRRLIERSNKDVIAVQPCIGQRPRTPCSLRIQKKIKKNFTGRILSGNINRPRQSLDANPKHVASVKKNLKKETFTQGTSTESFINITFTKKTSATENQPKLTKIEQNPLEHVVTQELKLPEPTLTSKSIQTQDKLEYTCLSNLINPPKSIQKKYPSEKSIKIKLPKPQEFLSYNSYKNIGYTAPQTESAKSLESIYLTIFDKINSTTPKNLHRIKTKRLQFKHLSSQRSIKDSKKPIRYLKII
jgi:hypothetical protein